VARQAEPYEHMEDLVTWLEGPVTGTHSVVHIVLMLPTFLPWLLHCTGLLRA
jgi:hypothetical protein